MGRRAALLILCALMAAGFSGCSLKSFEGLRYTVKDGGVVIRMYKDKSTVTVLEIPDEIDGKPVVKVENFGAFNAPSLKTIKIGKNVREIGPWAFTNNTALEAYIVDPLNAYFTAVDGVLLSKDRKTLIYYPIRKGVTTGKDGKVTGCAPYTVPAGVETIRTKAFYKCEYLETINLPASLLSIEERAFGRDSALKGLILPGKLQFIGKDAFAFCTSLTQLTVPASVSRIDDYAFYSCTSVKKLTMLGKEKDMTLGNKWYPTKNGMEMDDLKIIWVEHAG